MVADEPGSSEKAAGQEEEDTAPRRRRSLVVLLRQLKSTSGVWALERTAIKRRAQSTSSAEMLARTPEGLETPAYAVAASFEAQGWEVRKYREFGVATTARERAVTTDGAPISQPTMASAGAFQALAGYIFGKNSEDEKMAMTTPVLSRNGRMDFVLPSRYWRTDELAAGGLDPAAPPQPLDAGVTIIDGAGGGLLAESADVACLWFGGLAQSAEVARRRAELRALLEANPDWVACDPEEEAALLQYNDPFTPPWARRNEVALPVVRRSAPSASQPSGDAAAPLAAAGSTRRGNPRAAWVQMTAGGGEL